MGLPRGFMNLLLDEAVREPFTGVVGQLGRQSIFFKFEQLQDAAQRRHFTLSPVDPTLHRDPRLAEQGYLSDVAFFRALGFEDVFALDFSDFEQAELIVDLNRPVSPELHQRFDALMDGGTLEHVFHLPNALANIHAMLRPGGRIIHWTPAANFVDHGFYMLSPTFFWDYYSANEYDIKTIRFIRHSPEDPDPRYQILEVMDYAPGCLNSVNMGGLDAAIYETFVVAKKTAQSTADRIPQQGAYQKAWAAAQAPPVVAPEPPPSRGDRLLTATRDVPVVGAMTRAVLGVYRAARRVWDAPPRKKPGAPRPVLVRY